MKKAASRPAVKKRKQEKMDMLGPLLELLELLEYKHVKPAHVLFNYQL